MSAGINCSPSPDIQEIRVSKLILNCATNALSAIEQKPIGNLITDEKLQEVVYEIIKEAREVLKDEYNLPSLPSLTGDIYRKLNQVREHYSSMVRIQV